MARKAATIDLSGATTVEDLLNDVNSSGTGVTAQINDTGTGINILNPTQGTDLRIAENGGTTAADLGIRSFDANSPLSDLNDGKGVRTVDGRRLPAITDSNGVSFDVDLDDTQHSIQDVLDTINTAATTAGAGVTASFATTGNGIVLTDTAGGAGTLTAAPQNFSNALSDLGLTATASGGAINGTDIDPVQAQGLFANIIKLRDSLTSNDQDGVTEASEGLQNDLSRVTVIRGQNGATLQELTSRQNRLDDENIATKSLLSQLTDTDFTAAITQFQQLQTSLQASLESAGKILNMSLMDFLG